MKLETSFLRSKVAKRVFFLFVACALLPITALAVITYLNMGSQLREQSELELLQVSSPHLLGCLIAGNGQAGIKMHATTGGRRPLYCEPVIENCIIVDNGEAGIVGGKPVIVDSVIQGQ